MFLDSICKMGLLDHNPDSNILMRFPYDVRRGMVNYVATYLADPSTNATATLPSQTHVHFALECIGEGFRLNLEHSPIISSCLDIYAKWLADEHARPTAMNDKLEEYVLIMLDQLSLIFQPRSKNNNEIQIQVELCKRALAVYGLVVAKIPLSRKAWDRIQKLMIGVTDILFHPPPGEDAAFGKMLTAIALHSLYNIWLQSRCTDDSLWLSLRTLNRGWLLEPETVTQWNATMVGLTTYVINELYGPPSETHMPVQISVPPNLLTRLDGSDSHFLSFAWLRFLYLPGSINAIPVPAIYAQTMRGLAVCVQLFLEKVRNPQTVDAPDGNTILSLFGKELLLALLQNRQGFEEGTAVAISTLVQIFITCRSTRFNDQYLSAFYGGMKICLQSPLGVRVLEQILMDCQEFFSYEIPGSRVLIPYFVRALERVFTSTDKSIRPAGLNTLMSIICFPNRFQNARFPSDVVGASEPRISTYFDLEPHIGRILNDALVSEHEASNLRQIFWISTIFLLEFIPGAAGKPPPQRVLMYASEYALTFVTVALRVLLGKDWPADIKLSAVETLCDLSRIDSRFSQKDQLASLIVNKLCSVIDMHKKTGTKADDDVVLASFRCLTEWLMTSLWASNEPPVLRLVLTTCMDCINACGADLAAMTGGQNQSVQTPTEKDSTVYVSKAVGEAAMQCVLTMLAEWGAYPTSAGAERLSSLVSEETIVRKMMERADIDVNNAPSFMRFFALDEQRIITVIDVPQIMLSQGFSTILIVRDRTGRRAWRTNLRLSTSNATPCVDIPVEQNKPQCTTPYQYTRSLASQQPVEVFAPLFQTLDALGTGDMDRLVESEIQFEAQSLASKNYALSNSVALVKPVRQSYETEVLGSGENCKNIAGRALLNQMGYVSSSGKSLLTPMEATPPFLQSLKQLDQQPERLCMSVAVVYHRPGQTTEDEIFANEESDIGFKQLVSSLGWNVKIATHTGFLGGLDRKGSHGEVAPYFGDFSTEIIYHVATKMPENAKSDSKRRLLRNDPVLIVWSEDRDFNADVIQTSYRVKFVLHPLSNGLVNVTVRLNEKITRSIGPLNGSINVSKYVLGKLLMETAINAYREFEASQFGMDQSYSRRQRLLTDIIRRHRSPDVRASNFYQSLFLQSTTRAPGDGSSARLFGSPGSGTPDAVGTNLPPPVAVLPPMAIHSPPTGHHVSSVSQTGVGIPGLSSPRQFQVPLARAPAPEHLRTRSSQSDAPGSGSPQFNLGLGSPPDEENAYGRSSLHSSTVLRHHPPGQEEPRPSSGSYQVVRPHHPPAIPGVMTPGQQAMQLQQMQPQQRQVPAGQPPPPPHGAQKWSYL